MRKGDISGSYSNVSFTNKAVISIEGNLVTSVSQLRTLGFENCELKTKILPSKNSPEYPYKKE